MIEIPAIDPQRYLDDYIDWLDDRKADGTFKHNTVRGKTYAVDEFTAYCDYHEQNIDLDDLYGSIDTIKAFFEQTPITKNKVSAVRGFLDYIARQQPTEQAEKIENIRSSIKRSKLQGQVGSWSKGRKKELEDKILTEKEMAAIYGAAKPFEYLMIKCLLDTGCRPGELAALEPQDFNFDVPQRGIGATVKIEKTYSSSIGVQDHPKTEDSIRTVNLREDTAEMLQAWIDGHDIADDQLIFHDYRTVYDAFKDVLTFAHIKIGDDGITKLGPHAMRHNCCTRLIRDDYPKEKVQQYMGHSSVVITEIYEHFDEDEVLEIYA